MAICFCKAWGLRMDFTFLNGWKKIKRRIFHYLRKLYEIHISVSINKVLLAFSRANFFMYSMWLLQCLVELNRCGRDVLLVGLLQKNCVDAWSRMHAFEWHYCVIECGPVTPFLDSASSLRCLCYISISSGRKFLLFYIFTNTLFYRISNFNPSVGCAVISHCGFNWNFPDY